ncbi:hypothetical protein AMS68_007556 [Peltaster fructicola]|uniref:Uncharacterized protein n=1 Tax=Peltaster fructicola TaxID=286661 RepID=A0A6H0Y5D3_9PEZI|nr:hypothetical protein AMS68_007556 [Peltaster fructicola]
MSTAVAAPPPTASLGSTTVERNVSPRQYAATTSSPPSVAENNKRGSDSAGRTQRGNVSPAAAAVGGRASPKSAPRTNAPPMIKVKKEPGSPSMQSARHRPKRLDLSSSTPGARAPQTGRPSAPLTSRESAGLAIQDMGLACLSPGFSTNDPGMREQLQRSLDVRDQQRQIIEARQKGTRPGASHDSDTRQDTTLFGIDTRAPQTSRRKGPPPGLSINAPSAAHFANDRVIQSAPLNQTFTGLRPEHPYTRHVQHGPSHLSQTSHIHHVPATQTQNRLPPISDVFAHDRLDPPRAYPSSHSPAQSSHSNIPPPVPSPGFPPPQYQQHSASVQERAREFRSAEEAVHSMSGGREELLPKVVHYGGVQPPTPPSPMSQHRTHAAGPHSARPDFVGRTASMNGRRRGRDEYERDNGSSPPQRPEIKRTTFTIRGDRTDRDREDDWRSNMSGEEKRQEFLRLCERAWDLFHS